MKGVLLAGGQGTRLQGMTRGGNKHLLPVGGAPMITHGLEKLARAGIEEVLLVTGSHHLADFETFLSSTPFPELRIELVAQERPGGIGEGLALCRRPLGDGEEPVVLLELARFYSEQRELDRAEDCARRARALALETGQPLTALYSGQVWADVDLFRGEPERWRRAAARADALAGEATAQGYITLAGILRNTEAELFSQLGDRARALAAWGRSQDCFRRAGRRPFVVLTRFYMALALANWGAHAEAKALLQESLAEPVVRRRTHDHLRALIGLMQVGARLGEAPLLRRHLAGALALQNPLPMPGVAHWSAGFLDAVEAPEDRARLEQLMERVDPEGAASALQGEAST